MKWLFLLALIAGTPALANWLKTNQRYAPYVWASLGFLPFFLHPWHLLTAPVSWPMWPGYVDGVELTLLDAVALAIILSKTTTSYKIPFMFVFFAYVVACAITVPLSTVPVASSFYILQLLRVILVFAAVAKVAASERGLIAIVGGMILGIVVQSGYAIVARAGGAVQASGAMSHQNLLGFMSHLVILPSFALVLANRHVKLALCGLFFGVVAVILTASRASIGLGAAGLALVYILSVIRSPTGRKASLGLASAAVLLAAYPFAQQSLQRRYDSQLLARIESNGYDERAAFERAARMIIDDNPFGIGPNMYVTVANMAGYSEKAGVIWNTGSRSANVHNSYLLITAETGLIGLLAFLAVLGSAIAVAIATIARFRSDPRGELLVGVLAALIMISVHSFFEWILVISSSQYMFGTALGMVAGLRYQMQSAAQMSRPQRRRPAALVQKPNLQAARRATKDQG